MQTLWNKLGFQNSYNNDLSLNNKLTKYQDLSATKNPTSLTPTKVSYSTKDYIYFPVSKTNSLGQYFPDDLVFVPSNYATASIRVSKMIEDDLLKMLAQAKADGVDIKVLSGFRSYSDQTSLFNYYVSQEKINHPDYTQAQLIQAANQYSALPGYSEHQLGTTVDLASNENGYQLIADDNLKYIKWINANASKYNFRISFTKGNFEYIYEPWHLRWWPIN